MGSSRLPGKLLMEVMKRPLLSYQIERLRLNKWITQIVVATTTNTKDDPVVECAHGEQVQVYRGSEYDVLDRYYQAAKTFSAEHVIRLTGDCPLIDIDTCDRILNEYFTTGLDYVRTGESFAEGLDCEIMSFEALECSWMRAKLKSEREHVTLYIRNHTEQFAIRIVENETDDSKYRITIDEEADFHVVKAIFNSLYTQENPYFGIEAIKKFLNANPDIYALNANIIRNEGLLKSLVKDQIVIE
ncbi:MAG: glycosyltransferase family protein [Proteobacteria bacterium]|nr:glycosyltransferase family protein [Pseudomonadota bacterium]